MSKKHFKALADAMRDLQQRFGATIPADEMVHAIANVCSDDNPRFDWQRFKDACQPTHKP